MQWPCDAVAVGWARAVPETSLGGRLEKEEVDEEKEVFLGLRVQGAASSVWMGVGSAVSTRLRLPL